MMNKYLPLKTANLIAALRGPEFIVRDHFSVFGSDPWIRGEYCYSVDRIVKSNVGKGRLPKRCLIRTLNSINSKLPRGSKKQWHVIANEVVEGMPLGQIKRATYTQIARGIEYVLQSKNNANEFRNVPKLATIENWLKANKRVGPGILALRIYRAKKP
jgi:hypothetical protein